MSEITGRISTALVDRYRIESHLGEGGMATVFLAHDLKHNRKVALKVLRPELAAVIGAERFLKEIEVTAGLQHPHILPLHDSGDADSFLFYVMPYVEGESLRDKLKREKQLGVDEAIDITKAVATALDYAHRKGVIHRDIKPENILIHDGQALVADFGIALAVSHASGTRLTETGLSIGTPHYMSPEQAMGDRELDARSDVYSLGAMLYEMLAGDPPYTGSTAQAIVAKVITEKAPPVTAARDTVPNHIAAAIQQALAKLPADRFHSAAEFAAALTNPAFALPTVTMSLETGAPAVSSPVWQRFAVPAAAVLAILAAWGWLRPEPQPTVARYGLALPADQALDDGYEPSFAMAPDAAWMVYMGPGANDGQLWVKPRDRYEATPLAGTNGAFAPVVSPDGQWIAFVANAELRKVPAGGGSAITLADSVNMNTPAAAWMDDGTLVYIDGPWRVRRLPDVGGVSDVVYTPEGGRFAMLPSALPKGRGVLFKKCDGNCNAVSELWVADLRSGEARMLIPDVARGWFVDGLLVYVRRDGGVFAVPFDLGNLTLKGTPVPVFEGVQVAIGIVPDFALSATGTLTYVAGSAGGAASIAEAVWVARDGRATRVDTTWTFDPGPNRGWSLSPDGTRLALKILTESGEDIWIKELDRGPLSRLTFSDRVDERPRWAPDGRHVMFLSDRLEEENNDLYLRRGDGTGSDSLFIDIEASILEAVWSRDRQWVVLRTAGIAGATGMRDIVAMRPGIDTVPVPLLTGAYDEKAAALSPDGKWLAYESNETGRDEIFVRPFPNVDDGRWQISTIGGRMPLWARSGRELFFMNGEREMVAQAVTTRPTFQRGEQRVLFEIGPQYLLSAHYTPFDISPDDQRFIMVRLAGAGDEAGAPGSLIVVENWLQEVRQKMGR